MSSRRFCFSFGISFHDIKNKTWAWQVILLKLGAHVELYEGELWRHQFANMDSTSSKGKKGKKKNC
jgi:hypothetical protein